ncbi:MAG: type ISP restriction/modification enzyme, partial [bacterium]
EPTASYHTKKPNIDQKIYELLTQTYGKKPSPEQIFYYLYAVLYANTYRTQYAEFLKIDFPRVPFTTNYAQFIKMGKYGQKLVDLHLLQSNELKMTSVRFEGQGGNKVEQVRYEANRVYVNQNQYFAKVAKDIWEYQIGGYQVCHKWLKDRKGRPLSLEDIKHYCKVVTALQKTIDIQTEIDKLYPQLEKEVIDFNRISF